MKLSECKIGMKCKSNNNQIAINHIYEIIEIKKKKVVVKLENGAIYRTTPDCLDYIKE